jgi:hypothetical protein
MTRIIYPPLDEHAHLRQKLTDGEQAVLALFDQSLAPEWEIYIQPHLNGLRPDFVLLNPRVGIAVFEVKDWNLGAMRYFTETDTWGASLWAEKDGRLSVSRTIIRSPKSIFISARYTNFIARVLAATWVVDGRTDGQQLLLGLSSHLPTRHMSWSS